MRLSLCLIIISTSLFSGKLNIIDTDKSWKKYPSADTVWMSDTVTFAGGKILLTQTASDIKAIKKGKNAWLGKQIAKILKKNPGQKGMMKVGVLYATAGFNDSAMTWFNKAIALNPNNPDIYNNIAGIYYMKQDYPRALRFYQKAVDYSKNNPSILLNLAFVHYQMGDQEKAKEKYYTAILIDPTLDSDKYRVLAGEKK